MIATDRLSLNGESQPSKSKSKRKAPVKSTNKGKGKSRRSQIKTRLALLVGCVAAFVLLLSVWHCTEAIHVLTGSPIALSLLLALGVDMGMVACEVSAICCNDGSEGKRWSERYIMTAVVLSSALNSFASGLEASGLVQSILAYAVGACVPALSYMLAKVAGHLAHE